MSGWWAYAAWVGTTLLSVAVFIEAVVLLLKWRDADTFRDKAEALRSEADKWRERYYDAAERFEAAEGRADAADKALAEIRMKRSLAVSKGNRTRAEKERARILQTTEAVRVATARKKQPQGSLPL